MSGTNLTPMRPKDITPKVILETLNSQEQRLQDLFAVAVYKDGTISVSSSGPLSNLALASLTLQNYAIQCLNGTNNGQS